MFQIDLPETVLLVSYFSEENTTGQSPRKCFFFLNFTLDLCLFY